MGSESIVRAESNESEVHTFDEEDGWQKGFTLQDNGQYEPDPEVMYRRLMELESKGYCELQWQCPGRRPPTPQDTDEKSEDTENTAGEVKEEDNSDFEFKDEMSQLKLPVHPVDESPGARGSAKKKSSLDAIHFHLYRV
ncbi:hypothetical protein LSTR_LSTR000564 [Laodelphax striatellus]|uniref:Uncharacterized protein n=1 Tax=Laodelphax striatellus TaxID=195883 RepID=A0A482WP80_LAOST|nr:hypothetical protein LSTR_LSTR000564 [Laodelphax striatellus]